MIKVDLSGAAGFFDPAGPDYAAAAQAHRTLLEHTGAGADFTGWLDLPERMQSGELKQILAAASRIRGRSQALVVVGIGGSYLGAKGALELLRPRPQPGDPKILFAGNSLSPDALMHLLEELGVKYSFSNSYWLKLFNKYSSISIYVTISDSNLLLNSLLFISIFPVLSIYLGYKCFNTLVL